MDEQKPTNQQGAEFQSSVPQPDKIIYIFVGVIISAVVFGGYLTLANWQNLWPFESKPEQIACTKEAMFCPDGTAVGRTGPNCEFAECPVSMLTPMPDPTANWQTYRNDEYGFEVRYPEDWTMKSTGADNGEVTFFKTGIQSLIGVISIQDGEFGAEKIRTIIVNGERRDLMRFADNPCGGFDVNIPYRGKFLVFSVYECIGRCDPETDPEGLGTLDCRYVEADVLLTMILSTLKFTQ